MNMHTLKHLNSFPTDVKLGAGNVISTTIENRAFRETGQGMLGGRICSHVRSWNVGGNRPIIDYTTCGLAEVSNVHNSYDMMLTSSRLLRFKNSNGFSSTQEGRN
jgi:hypothetical protein